ncbi:MAG: peptidyl-prolyl cis-trans isomerase [Phycisphaerales bacterium]|nr:MAG: peptidyl-prolyl cis-trans isomerase [Phycisphaerales bacterium]
MSLEEFEKKAAEYGQSFGEFREQLGRQLTYEKLLEPQWAGKIDFNDQDAKKYYDENLKRYTSPEQVRASHILITPDKSDPNTDPNQAKAKALAKTRDLLKQINEGADFAELAKANSKDPGSASRGGDLDYFPRGKMVAPFDKAAFELEVGKISDIVETNYGYHIIKVTDHKEAGVTPFEEVSDGIIEELTQRKKSEFAKEYIESLRAKADIVYPPGKEPAMSMPPGAPAPGR